MCLYNERYLGSPSNRDEKGVATSATCSISHPACPRVKGVVRGCLNVGVTVFREVDDGKVRAASQVNVVYGTVGITTEQKMPGGNSTMLESLRWLDCELLHCCIDHKLSHCCTGSIVLCYSVAPTIHSSIFNVVELARLYSLTSLHYQQLDFQHC